MKYLNYSFVTPDTNAAELMIEPFVMARKNFLFSGGGKRAESSCFIFTLIETAKAYGVKPGKYFRCMFEQDPYAESEENWKNFFHRNIKNYALQNSR